MESVTEPPVSAFETVFLSYIERNRKLSSLAREIIREFALCLNEYGMFRVFSMVFEMNAARIILLPKDGKPSHESLATSFNFPTGDSTNLNDRLIGGAFRFGEALPESCRGIGRHGRTRLMSICGLFIPPRML